MARLVSYGVSAVEPGMFGLGPIPAVRQALDRAGWKIGDIERIEINEAFAAIAIAVTRELGLSEDIVNVEGGAIAHGHPIGATGAVLTDAPASFDEAGQDDARRGDALHRGRSGDRIGARGRCAETDDDDRAIGTAMPLIETKMNSQIRSAGQLDAEVLREHIAKSIHEHWLLYLLEGIVLVVLGLAAVIVPPLAGLAVAIFVGWLFLMGGSCRPGHDRARPPRPRLLVVAGFGGAGHRRGQPFDLVAGRRRSFA